MITLEHVSGNIIDMIDDGMVDAVAHGYNCFHVVGAGIANQLNYYTDGVVEDVDMKTSFTDINKLGEYSKAVITIPKKGEVTIGNLYTQYGLGAPDHVSVHWASLYNALYNFIKNEMVSGEALAIPYIGCGLGGGDKEDFEDLVVNRLVIASTRDDHFPFITLKVVSKNF